MRNKTNLEEMNQYFNINFFRLSISLFFLAAFSFVQAQNTLVMGTIENNLAREIEIQINQKYLNDEVDLYKSNVLEDGTFMFAVQINEPQLAKIIYARNEALIYLEPNDTLVINSEANSFQYALKFSGRGGANNNCLFKYIEENPPIMNPWQLLQYKKGIFWFANEQTMDNKMQRLKGGAFSEEMSKKRDKSMSMLLEFQNQEHERELTEDFISYLETDIYFSWAYHMLLYGSVYKNMHQLDEATFFNFLDDIAIHDRSLGNYWYRNFLLAYINHKAMEENKEGDEYVNQIKLADTLLQSKQQAFVKAHLIYKAFYAKRADQIILPYIDFLETNPYQIFDEKVTGAYEKAMKYAVGTPAPDFSIKNKENVPVNLLDFQGKVVFLNFWASWCRPCIKKMNRLKPIQRDLESRNIVFLNISLDRDRSAWLNSVELNGFKGVHVLAEGALESDVSALYEVKALPQYFIVDKRGNFAEKPLVKGEDALKMTLEYLNNR